MENQNAPDFLSVVMNYLANRPNSKVMLLVENQSGGFETLQNDPNFVWAFGMLRMGENVLKSRLDECRNSEMERLLREKTEREANGIDVSKGKAN